MVTLPEYTSNETLDTGARFLRPIRPDTSIGRSIDGLGNSLEGLATQIGKERKTEEAKLEAQEKADENLALDINVNDFRLELERERGRFLENAGDDPSGLSEHMEQFARTRAGDLQKTTFKDHHNPLFVEKRLRTAMQSFLQETSRTELTGRVRFRLQQADAKLGLLDSTIASNHRNTSTALEEWNDYVENVVNAPGDVKAEMKKHGVRRLTRAHLRSLVNNDPAKAQEFIQRFSKFNGGKSPKAQANPPGQVEQGNIDLDARGAIRNSDGSVSTVSSISISEDGNEVLIPTIVDGKRVSEDKAIERYRSTGQHLGKFKDTKSATAFAKRLSSRQGFAVQRFRNEGDRAVYNAATGAGVDPAALFAIGHIESRNQDNRGNPIINGRRASSAIGRFQVIAASSTLNALGLSREDRRDITKVAPAFADYYKRQEASLKSGGFRGDAAEVYMTWNIGPGPARALLRAAQLDPSQSFSSVIVPVLRKSGHGPRFIAQYMANNPAFYSPNTPIGTVVARYRGKIKNAFQASGNLLEGAGGLSDKVAQESLKGLTDVDTSSLNAKDVTEVFSELLPAIRKQAKDNVELLRGEAKVNGEVATKLGDSDDQKDVNNYSKRLDFGPRIVEGDAEATTKARIMVENSKFIPEDITNALVGAIDRGGEGSARAYEFMADVFRKEPDAFRHTSIPSEIRNRIEKYDALTQGGVLMTPGQAIKIIERAASERGKLNLKAVKDTVDEELKRIEPKDIEAKFNATVFDFASPQGMNDSARNLLLKTYRDHYTLRRSESHTAEESDLFATEQMKKVFGVSTVATERREQTLMPYPPERHYRPSAAEGDHEWIRRQAKNFVASTFMLGPGEASDQVTQDDINKIEVRIIPTGQTAEDVASNRSPSYMVAFKRADGRIDVVPEHFTPSQELADTEDRLSLERSRDPRPIFEPGSPIDRLLSTRPSRRSPSEAQRDAPFVEGPGLPE